MKKARIIEVKVGVKTFYCPQIQERVLFIFKVWSSVGWVSLSAGYVAWYRQHHQSIEEANAVLNNYETLFGVELDTTLIVLKPFKDEKNNG